jgi:t-SNARE complex subunit (syntaxin)
MKWKADTHSGGRITLADTVRLNTKGIENHAEAIRFLTEDVLLEPTEETVEVLNHALKKFNSDAKRIVENAKYIESNTMKLTGLCITCIDRLGGTIEVSRKDAEAAHMKCWSSTLIDKETGLTRLELHNVIVPDEEESEGN